MYILIHGVNSAKSQLLTGKSLREVDELEHNMSEHANMNLSKLSVSKDLRVAVKRIAADRDEFIYDLADKVFRDAFPEYFQKTDLKH